MVHEEFYRETDQSFPFQGAFLEGHQEALNAKYAADLGVCFREHLGALQVANDAFLGAKKVAHEAFLKAEHEARTWRESEHSLYGGDG